MGAKAGQVEGFTSKRGRTLRLPVCVPLTAKIPFHPPDKHTTHFTPILPPENNAMEQ